MYIDKKLLNLWQECNPSYFILVSCEKNNMYKTKRQSYVPLLFNTNPKKRKARKSIASQKKKKCKDMCGYIWEKRSQFGTTLHSKVMKESKLYNFTLTSNI